MVNNQKIDFKYIDYSNNLFTKFQYVNALTESEFSKLNEKYRELGLFIKQVKVDEYGNEINKEEIISDNNVLKQKRKRLIKKSKMTLEEFYKKYYDNNHSNNNKKSKKINENRKDANKSISSKSIENNKNVNDKCNIEELEDLNNNLKETYNDCQNIEIKKCKIEEKEFKEKIIDYIKRFSKYISEKQYSDLFNKWKNKNLEKKGYNYIEQNDLNDWTIPVLKAFKSEIILVASSNILNKKIGKNNNQQDFFINEEREEEENEEREEEKNEEESESDSSSVDNYFKAKYIASNQNDDKFDDEN